MVDTWETVTDSSLSRELLGGLKWTEWPGVRQLAVSPGRLCRECAAIDFSSQSIELQRNLQDLCKSAEGCALCGFRSRRLSAGGADPQELLRLVRVGTKIECYPVDRAVISLYCEPGASTRGPPNNCTSADLRPPQSPGLLLPLFLSPSSGSLCFLMRQASSSSPF